MNEILDELSEQGFRTQKKGAKTQSKHTADSKTHTSNRYEILSDESSEDASDDNNNDQEQDIESSKQNKKEKKRIAWTRKSKNENETDKPSTSGHRHGIRTRSDTAKANGNDDEMDSSNENGDKDQMDKNKVDLMNSGQIILTDISENIMITNTQFDTLILTDSNSDVWNLNDFNKNVAIANYNGAGISQIKKRLLDNDNKINTIKLFIIAAGIEDIEQDNSMAMRAELEEMKSWAAENKVQLAFVSIHSCNKLPMNHKFNIRILNATALTVFGNNYIETNINDCGLRNSDKNGKRYNYATGKKVSKEVGRFVHDALNKSN